MVSQLEVAFKLTQDTIDALVNYHKNIYCPDLSADTYAWPDKGAHLSKLQADFVQAINKYVYRTGVRALEGIDDGGSGELLDGRALQVKSQILDLFLPLNPPPPRIVDLIRPTARSLSGSPAPVATISSSNIQKVYEPQPRTQLPLHPYPQQHQHQHQMLLPPSVNPSPVLVPELMSSTESSVSSRSVSPSESGWSTQPEPTLMGGYPTETIPTDSWGVFSTSPSPVQMKALSSSVASPEPTFDFWSMASDPMVMDGPEVMGAEYELCPTYELPSTLISTHCASSASINQFGGCGLEFGMNFVDWVPQFATAN
jgi:hypothetical protein